MWQTQSSDTSPKYIYKKISLAKPVKWQYSCSVHFNKTETKILLSVDKHWSWIVLFGAFLANLLGGGIVFSFGILYTDFRDRLQTGALETAFIGTIAFACFCFGGKYRVRTLT